MYDAEVDGTVTSFGTSGFLYQSNKLMYDRATNTLWQSLTGEPVIGPLADSDLQLTSIPIDVVRWSDWLDAHPDTTVLSLRTGYSRPYLPPSDPGSAYYEYFNSPDRMFPTFTEDDRLGDKEPVLGLQFGDYARAYPIMILEELGVVNDVVGDQGVVIVSELGRGARAYQRGGLRFSSTGRNSQLVDNAGTLWQITGDGLVAGDGSRFLERLPSRELFWLGWSAFYPLTDVFGDAGETG